MTSSPDTPCFDPILARTRSLILSLAIQSTDTMSALIEALNKRFELDLGGGGRS